MLLGLMKSERNWKVEVVSVLEAELEAVSYRVVSEAEVVDVTIVTLWRSTRDI